MIYLQGIISDNEMFDVIWQVVEHKVDIALKKGGSLISAKDVYKMLKNKDAQLWIVKENETIKVAYITSIKILPDCYVLEIVALFGNNIKKYLDFIEENIVKFAKEHGCQYIEIVGRKGWERMLRNKGYKTVSLIIRKEV